MAVNRLELGVDRRFAEHGAERVWGGQHDVENEAGWTYQFVDVDRSTGRLDGEFLEPFRGQRRSTTGSSQRTPPHPVR
jgi:hypothetical protein